MPGLFLFYAIRNGLISRLDLEKLRFFLGMADNPLFLSRRLPLYRRLGLLRLIFSPRYAAAVADWLLYRVELYDGRRG